MKEVDNLIKEDYSLRDSKLRRIDSNVALLTYRAKLKGIYKGQPFQGEYYASSVWANRDGKWRNVFYQETMPANDAEANFGADAQARIRQIEQQWAKTAVTNDASVLERILADDFLGTDPHGNLYTKADAIKEAKSGPSALESNHLNDTKIRFFANVAVVQGSESFKRKDGKTGRFIWTDALVRRDGKWQVVAAEDMLVAEKK